MITSIIGSLIVGFIIGAFARMLTPGPDRLGCLMTALLGIAGSFLGSVLGNLIWRISDHDPYLHPRRLVNFVLSVIGAVVLLWGLRVIRGRD